MLERSKIRILVACEESNAVSGRFNDAGFDSWSCDLQYSSDIFNKKHYRCSVFDIINDGWHCLIAFPPCTHLAVTGAKHFLKKEKDGRQAAAIEFFMAMVNAPIHRIAIENPVGIMSGLHKPPTQIVEPYYFGDKATKKTCLWLKNLPPLFHNAKPDLFNPTATHVDRGREKVYGDGSKFSKWYAETSNLPHSERSKARSKTFNGIADAMVDQWSPIIERV